MLTYADICIRGSCSAGSENYYVGVLRQPYKRNNNTPSLAGCMENGWVPLGNSGCLGPDSSSCRLAPWLLSFVTLHESFYPRRIPHILLPAAPTLHFSNSPYPFFLFSLSPLALAKPESVEQSITMASRLSLNRLSEQQMKNVFRITHVPRNLGLGGRRSFASAALRKGVVSAGRPASGLLRVSASG